MPIPAPCPGCGQELHEYASVYCDTVTPDLPPLSSEERRKRFLASWTTVGEMREDAKNPHGMTATSELTTARIAAQTVAVSMALLEQATEVMTNHALDTESLQLDPCFKAAADHVYAQVQGLRDEWAVALDALMHGQFVTAGQVYIDHVARVVAYSYAYDAMQESKSRRVSGVEGEAKRYLHWDSHLEFEECPSCQHRWAA